MRLRQKTEQKPVFGFKQIARLKPIAAELLSLPLTRMQSVLFDMLDGPEIWEKTLTRCKEQYRVGTRGAFITLMKEVRDAGHLASGNTGVRGPVIRIAKLLELEEPTRRNKVDVTFTIEPVGVRAHKSSHLVPLSSDRLLSLPKSEKAVGEIVSWLSEQQAWQIDTLYNIYRKIGSFQRAFLSTLNPMDLRPLPLSRIDSEVKLGLHETTYWRLLKGRSVDIDFEGEDTWLPVEYLIPTERTLERYRRIRNINQVFLKEFGDKCSYSDAKIAAKSSTNKRTVNKYRTDANIPSKEERQEAYTSGRDSLFRVYAEIEGYVPYHYLLGSEQRTTAAKNVIHR